MADGGKEMPEGAEISRVGYRYRPGAEQKGPDLLVRMELAGPSSGDLTYTVHVVDADDSGARPLASQALDGDGGDALAFELAVNAGAEQRIAIYATSSSGDREYDRYPPEGTFAVDQPLPAEAPLAGEGPHDHIFGP